MSDTIGLGSGTMTTTWMPDGITYAKFCPQCNGLIYDGYAHSCGGGILMSSGFDAPLQFASEVDPVVLSEIKQRALMLQSRPTGKDLDGATVQSLLADILLLCEALE